MFMVLCKLEMYIFANRQNKIKKIKKEKKREEKKVDCKYNRHETQCDEIISYNKDIIKI